jgi:hypothetical protein
MTRPHCDPRKLRALARGCRELAKTAIVPANIEQLKLWATELADAADEIERRLEAGKRLRHMANRRERRRA